MSILRKLANLLFKEAEPKIAMKPDKIVVGLGNPGAKFRGTRHNVGFMVLAELARRCSCGTPVNKFYGDATEARVGEKNVLFLCPTTYMNRSGQAVEAVLRFYKLNIATILVVADDVDLPVGRIRFRSSGGSGGQKGIKDIIMQIGSEKFSRLRIGIGRPPETVDMADYVLSGFTPEEKEKMDNSIQKGADAVLCWIESGTEETANRFNGQGRHSNKDPGRE